MVIPDPAHRLIQSAIVTQNRPLCRQHYRLRMQTSRFPDAQPGQFLHLSPQLPKDGAFSTVTCAMDDRNSVRRWRDEYTAPMIRRAFSIASLDRHKDGVSLDVIYRVVGTATRWMESLKPDDSISVLGPLGNRFNLSNKPSAWLVAGGVGIPPMLWLAEALSAAGKNGVAFCGAQTSELLALSLGKGAEPSPDATHAVLCAEEFARHDVPVVVSTDDGSLGFAGHIGSAMVAYHAANPTSPQDLIVYTCGPERMMEFVAKFCAERGIECEVCMERAMACGMGTCQSCVLPVHDATDPDGWRYELCCTGGPVFDAEKIIWSS